MTHRQRISQRSRCISRRLSRAISIFCLSATSTATAKRARCRRRSRSSTRLRNLASQSLCLCGEQIIQNATRGRRCSWIRCQGSACALGIRTRIQSRLWLICWTRCATAFAISCLTMVFCRTSRLKISARQMLRLMTSMQAVLRGLSSAQSAYARPSIRLTRQLLTCCGRCISMTRSGMRRRRRAFCCSDATCRVRFRVPR